MARFNQNEPRWEVCYRMPEPNTCFPAGYDTSNLIEVSRAGEQWATFLNPETGEEIKCADFHKKMMEEISNEYR